MYSYFSTHEYPLPVIVIQPYQESPINDRMYLVMSNPTWKYSIGHLAEDISITNFSLIIYVDSEQTHGTIYNFMNICELIKPLDATLFR